MVSGSDAALRALAAFAPVEIVGSVSGSRLTIVAGEARIELPLERLREAHASLGELFD